jgi:hypothetical protein
MSTCIFHLTRVVPMPHFSDTCFETQRLLAEGRRAMAGPSRFQSVQCIMFSVMRL